ncbi:hypothetical protein [Streptomyces bohaiensis]|uniref:DUF4352 domain-containing protein n=1 Tax=Streptomyces bohaiensis TaxID=1431344 RepID=A0ABX1CC80_9ACTN|nr:hypothetical protein [Streptomyces bohaiensis]NJQ14997.1 hypothetical protein [Streptomyces bohaiensis]
MARSTTWLTAAVPVAALSLALTACGGDSDGGADGTDRSGIWADAEEETDDGEDTEGRTDDTDVRGEADEDGPTVTTFAVGETSHPVTWGVATDDEQAVFTLSVDKVHVGEAADIDSEALANVDTEGRRPVHVHMTYTHQEGELTWFLPSEPTHLRMTLEDGSRGGNIRGSNDFGMPEGCDGAPMNGGATEPGDTYPDCRTFLIPEDVDVTEVRWELEADELVWAVD